MKELLRKTILFSIMLYASFGVMAQLAFETSVKHTSCEAGTDAQIIIDIISGRSGNIIVQWENNATKDNDIVVVKGAPSVVTFPVDGQKQQPIPSGEYVITVVDASDVKSIDSKSSNVDVKQPSAIEIDVQNPTNGIANGEIRVKTVNPDDFYSYSYSLDNGENFQEAPIFKNLIAKTYKLIVTITSENTTCSQTYSVEVKPE
jgi:hypothetical protein